MSSPDSSPLPRSSSPLEGTSTSPDEQHQQRQESSQTTDAMNRGRPRYRHPQQFHPSFALPTDPSLSSARHTKCPSCTSSLDEHGFNEDGLSPPLLSSPSIASSLSFSTPGSAGSLRRRLSRSTLHDQDHDRDSLAQRQHLAKRLNFLAQRLAFEDDIDEAAITEQIEDMERTFARSSHSKWDDKQDAKLRSPRTPRTSSDFGSVISSPVSDLIRAEMTQMSLRAIREQEEERARELYQPESTITVRQAMKIISETNKLNDEMEIICANLQARQEETDHINSLLIERTERAAERIVFLQNRIEHLDQELKENDEELFYLGINLQGVYALMPRHPDEALVRGVEICQQEYADIKERRAQRTNQRVLSNSSQPHVKKSAQGDITPKQQFTITRG